MVNRVPDSIKFPPAARRPAGRHHTRNIDASLPAGQNHRMADTDDRDEVLTLREVARILKTRTNQIYELTRRRAKARTDSPLPVFKVHSKMARVKKSDLMKWIDDLIKESRADESKKP